MWIWAVTAHVDCAQICVAYYESQQPAALHCERLRELWRDGELRALFGAPEGAPPFSFGCVRVRESIED